MLSVSVQEGEREVAQFIDRYGLDYPFLMDFSGDVSVDYGVTTTPTTYFVSPDGEIVDTLAGVVSVSWLEKNIRQYISS